MGLSRMCALCASVPLLQDLDLVLGLVRVQTIDFSECVPCAPASPFQNFRCLVQNLGLVQGLVQSLVHAFWKGNTAWFRVQEMGLVLVQVLVRISTIEPIYANRASIRASIRLLYKPLYAYYRANIRAQSLHTPIRAQSLHTPIRASIRLLYTRIKPPCAPLYLYSLCTHFSSPVGASACAPHVACVHVSCQQLRCSHRPHLMRRRIHVI